MRSLMIWMSCQIIISQVHPTTCLCRHRGTRRYGSNSFATSPYDWDGWSAPRPGRFTPENTRYSLYRMLGWNRDRFGRTQKVSAVPVFNPRIIQFIANRYTDWVIAAAYRIYTRWLNPREWGTWLLWFWWENPEEKRTLERTKSRWKNNNKIEFM